MRLHSGPSLPPYGWPTAAEWQGRQMKCFGTPKKTLSKSLSGHLK